LTSLRPPDGGIARGAPSGENAVKWSSLRPGLSGIADTSTRACEELSVTPDVPELFVETAGGGVHQQGCDGQDDHGDDRLQVDVPP
jgi:hypothetical protein